MNEINSVPNSSKMNPMVILGGVILLGALAFFLMRPTAQETIPAADSTSQGNALESSSDGTAAGTRLNDNELPEGETPVNDDTADSNVEIVSVEAGAFYYKPNEIRVKKGQTVRIEMKSADMMHDFTIDELGVSMPVVTAGNTGTVEFVADTVGEFEFYCSVGEHRANGQVGTLIVEEA